MDREMLLQVNRAISAGHAASELATQNEEGIKALTHVLAALIRRLAPDLDLYELRGRIADGFPQHSRRSGIGALMAMDGLIDACAAKPRTRPRTPRR